MIKFKILKLAKLFNQLSTWLMEYTNNKAIVSSNKTIPKFYLTISICHQL